MLTTVTCQQCADFIPPPAIYEKRSMGSCRSFDAGVERINRERGRKPNAREWDEAMKARGSKLFFATADRYCRQYKPLTNGGA